jgi:hypothetical protein
MRRKYKREFEERQQPKQSHSVERVEEGRSDQLLWMRMKRELVDACELLQITGTSYSLEELCNLLSAMGYLMTENMNAMVLKDKVWKLLSRDDRVSKINLLIFLAAVMSVDISEEEYQALTTVGSAVRVQDDLMSPEISLIASIPASSPNRSEQKLAPVPVNDRFLSWKGEFILLNDIQRHNVKRRFIDLAMN